MKKIVQINTVLNGSTGNIMRSIQEMANQNGFDCYVCASYSSIQENDDNHIISIGNHLSETIHYYLGTYLSLPGFFSYFSTKQLIKKIKRINPDIIHLHNLHDNYINLSLLFKYIKKSKVKVIWTLHDCWAMTGKCPHFTLAKCDKWIDGCSNCPELKTFPTLYLDTTKYLYCKKKKWFTGIDNLQLVTPSNWLSEIVKKSYLKEYPITVINNGIDLNVFKPEKSDFRKRYNIENKKMILCVSFIWNNAKGFDVIINLAKILPDDYCLVLVGTNETIDKLLPNNVISIHKTENKKELAQIYSAADVFFNPTREEVLGLVNIESLACGTPVVSFKTGGCVEVVDEYVGCLIEDTNVETILSFINYTIKRKIDKNTCIERTLKFSGCEKYREYINLYKSIIKD